MDGFIGCELTTRSSVA